MGRDTKAELKRCLRHNTELMATIESQDREIGRIKKHSVADLRRMMDAAAALARAADKIERLEERWKP